MLSLDDFSTGNAFGEQFFRHSNMGAITTRKLPVGVWSWTDDTAMAISIVEVLEKFGTIEQDELAMKFASRFMAEPKWGT